MICSQAVPQALAIALVVCLAIPTPARAAEEADTPILIGLDADMSASTAIGGEAIRRGVIIALDEINRAGGVLGRPMHLVVRDHRGNPDRGIDNIREFATMDGLVAVMGGIQSPVVMAELEAIHEYGIVYLGPWAAGTLVVDNAHDPNFVFRVSVRDEYAGEFLIDSAFDRGFRKPALLLGQTAWGRSSEIAMTAALKKRESEPAAVEWFNRGTKSVAGQLDAIMLAGADVVMLVAASDGAAVVVQDMAALPEAERLPIIAHWGMTAGDFHTRTGDVLGNVELKFLQTFSFFDPPFPDRAQRALDGYCTHFDGCDGPASVRAPTGTAHAYDLVHLLARAVDRAGTIERAQVRRELEALERHDGLIRSYKPPFTSGDHDALGPSDFRLAAYARDGTIVPLDLR